MNLPSHELTVTVLMTPDMANFAHQGDVRGLRLSASGSNKSA
jgi:hypothetical protein